MADNNNQTLVSTGGASETIRNNNYKCIYEFLL